MCEKRETRATNERNRPELLKCAVYSIQTVGIVFLYKQRERERVGEREREILINANINLVECHFKSTRTMNFNNEENNDICLKYVALRIYNVLDFFLLYN